MTAEKDWNDKQQVEWYNQNLQFLPADIEEYVAPLKLKADDCLADFGCGNGDMLLYLAGRVGKLVGIDESRHQLEEGRAKTKNLKNVAFIESRLQDCKLDGYKFTKGSGRKSLHHLTDEEKPVFFKNIGRSFTKGALFVIEDMVFDFLKKDLAKNLPKLESQAEAYYGEKWPPMKEQFMYMVHKEFPTDFETWRDSLAAGGFKVVNRIQKNCFYGKLLAEKE